MTVVDEINPEEVGAEIVPFTRETLEPINHLAIAEWLTAISLDIPADAEIEYETFESLGTALGAFDRACRWWVGDWLLYGERSYEADRYAEAARHTGLSEETLRHRIWVSQSIIPRRRRPLVGYSCHAAVAGLTPREQTRWLKYAEENQSTVAELRSAIKAAKATGTQESTDPPPDPHEVNPTLLLEAATSLVNNASEAGENVIVRIEDFVRVKAALGMEG